MIDVSFVIPIYNVEKYLRICIESIQKQKFSGTFEIICINDGSPDRSIDILQEYSEKDSRILVINQTNRGLSAARNVGLRKARGKYVMFIDSDDYLKHDLALSLMFHNASENNVDILVADFEYDFLDKTKNYQIKRHDFIKGKLLNGKTFYDLGMAKTTLMSVVWNKLYLRDFLLQNDLFFIEGVLYEDMDFTPKAFYLANKVKHIDEVVYMYRQREGSIMNVNNVHKADDFFVLADSLNEFNKRFNSSVLLNAKLYIYILIMKNIMRTSDIELKKKNIEKLLRRNVGTDFLKSSNIKYKLVSVFFSSLFLKIQRRKYEQK